MMRGVGNTRKLSDVGNTRKLSGTDIDNILNSADKTFAETSNETIKDTIESTILAVIRKYNNVVIGENHLAYDHPIQLLSKDEVQLGFIDCSHASSKYPESKNDCILFTSKGIYQYQFKWFIRNDERDLFVYLPYDKFSSFNFSKKRFSAISSGSSMNIITTHSSVSQSQLLNLLIELQESLRASSAFQVDRYMELLSMRDLNSVNAVLDISSKFRKKEDLINALIIQNPEVLEAKALAIENIWRGDDINELSLSQLQRLLIQRGISSEGNKSELNERLQKELVDEKKVFRYSVRKEIQDFVENLFFSITAIGWASWFVVLPLLLLVYAMDWVNWFDAGWEKCINGVILMIIGIPIWSKGYVIHENIIHLMGFILGFGIVTLIGIGNNEPFLFTMIVALGVGMILGTIFYYVILLSVFLTGTIVGSLIAQFFIVSGLIDGGLITILAFGIIGGSFALSLRKFVIITATSFIGSLFIIGGFMIPYGFSLSSASGSIMSAFILLIPLSLFGSMKQYQN